MKSTKEIVDTLMQKFSNGQPVMRDYLPTGLKEVDKVTFGLRKGELTVIGGRPGMGKTALMLQLAMNIAGQGKSVLFYSLNSSEEQLAIRALSSLTEIAANKIQQLKLDEQEHKRLSDAARLIQISP